jgi:hypothetical protein
MRVLEALLSPLSYRIVRLFIFLIGAGAMKSVEHGDLRAVVVVAMCLALWNWRPLLYALPDLRDHLDDLRHGRVAEWISDRARGLRRN